jgi:outer membrane receptor protein involved in Fe transport
MRAGDLASWTTSNASVGYRVTQALEIRAAANNVFNAMPPVDHSYPGSGSVPYNQYNYNVYGRSLAIDMSYQIGR